MGAASVLRCRGPGGQLVRVVAAGGDEESRTACGKGDPGRDLEGCGSNDASCRGGKKAKAAL